MSDWKPPALRLRLKPLGPNTTIEEMARSAVSIAETLGIAVDFALDGTSVVTTPSCDPEVDLERKASALVGDYNNLRQGHPEELAKAQKYEAWKEQKAEEADAEFERFLVAEKHGLNLAVD